MGFIIWGIFAYVGWLRVRFLYGIVASFAAAVALTGLGAAASQSDPICDTIDCSVTVGAFAYNVAIKFSICLLFYGLGRAVAFAASRIAARRTSTVGPER